VNSPRSDSEAGRYRIHGQCECSHVEGVEEAIEARGCNSVLPSGIRPDLNPIEQLFAKLKSMLRRLRHILSSKRRTPSIFMRRHRLVSDQITRSECAAYLANSGYVNLIGKRLMARRACGLPHSKLCRTRDDRSFAVQWLACALPADASRRPCGRLRTLGASAVATPHRKGLHPLLLAGLPRTPKTYT